MLPAFSTLTTRLNDPLNDPAFRMLPASDASKGSVPSITLILSRSLRYCFELTLDSVLDILWLATGTTPEMRLDALLKKLSLRFPACSIAGRLSRRETHRVRIANVVRARLRVVRETSLRFRRVHTLRLELAPLLPPSEA